MAMTTCKDCGTEVSRAAAACPKCGRKFSHTSPITWGCAALLLAAMMGVCFSVGNHPPSPSASTQTTGTMSPLAGVPSGRIADAGMDEEEKAAFLKTKAGRLWKKHPEWGPGDCKSIAAGKIGPGMTTDMVRAAWGRPEHRNVSTYASGDHEQWVYNGNNYVYFEKGVMTSLQQTK